MDQQHILVLGATGASGVAFIEAVLELSQQPYVTLFVRPGSRSKLPGSVNGRARIRIVEGALANTQALKIALSASDDASFPAATTVVSFLGAYLSVKAIFTRDQSHPIADALRIAVLPTMKSCNVPRIMVLSTPTAFLHSSESKSMPWKWWFYTMIPLLFAPQGNAEMAGIANAVASAGAEDDHLEWTIFRVPHLNDGNPSAEIVSGNLDQKFTGSTELSRGSLARWVLKEVEGRNWIRQAPLLGNA